ncbi:MAG: hypothetical protein ACRC8S_22785 [Fimbriiglobus sp.]
MAIAFRCPECDKAYKVDDRFAGRDTTCKQCDTLILIPSPGPEFEAPEETGYGVVEEKPDQKPKSLRSAFDDDDEAPRRSKRRNRDDDDDEDEAPRRSSSSRVSTAARHAAEEADKQARREARRERRREETAGTHSGISLDRAVYGGIAMMVISAVLGGGMILLTGKIFICLIVMFFLGIVSVIKGLMGYGDG